MNIVFDFGAVLFNWQPHAIVQSLFPARAATAETARELAGDIFHHEDWQSFDRGTVAQDEVVARTARRLGLPHPDMDRLVSGIPDHLKPIPGTVELLAGLHRRRREREDIRLYFLSNMPEPYARSLQQRHDFLQCFDGGMFSGDVQLIKPEAAIFRMLASRYALDPGSTVFIDDLPANVQAARALGWHGIHFESPEQLARSLAPHLP